MNLLKCWKKKKKRQETNQEEDPKAQHTPPGEKQSEASIGSLILLPWLQVLFKSL
jgi:hypothetical protein